MKPSKEKDIRVVEDKVTLTQTAQGALYNSANIAAKLLEVKGRLGMCSEIGSDCADKAEKSPSLSEIIQNIDSTTSFANHQLDEIIKFLG